MTSQPEGQCHKGASQASQMIWMENKIKDLEGELVELRALEMNHEGACVRLKKERNEARRIAEEMHHNWQHALMRTSVTLPWR